MTFIKRPSYEQLRQQLNHGGPKLEENDKPEQDDIKTIKTWLTRTYLFHGIPFNYVVPDERMLPTESLRFFQVDNNWMEVLVDGAFSLGAGKATPDADKGLLHENNQVIRNKAKQERWLVRQCILQKAKGPAAEKAAKKIAAGMPGAPGLVSGFFLRSMVVTGWPGIQVYGFPDPDGQQEQLTILRMELLSPSLLFVLFDGIVKSVLLEEPEEGVHFGVSPNTADPVTMELRYVESGDNHTTGQIIDNIDTKHYEVLLRDNDFKILRAHTFAHQLMNENELWPAGYTREHIFTAAQFALEMVQNVQQVKFKHETVNNPI